MIAAPPIDLGRGYTAQVAAHLWQGGPMGTRTLTLRHGRVVLQRFTAQDVALRLKAVDITGDGVRDVLAWNDTDGSGGCGSYRLYAGERLREVYAHGDGLDTFVAKLTAQGLETWRAIAASKVGTTIHCCYRHWLRTTRRWTSGRLAIVGRTVVPNGRIPHW